MTAIHLCIDFQAFYLTERPIYRAWWPKLRANIAVLADSLDSLGIRTVYVAYDESVWPWKDGVVRRDLLSEDLQAKADIDQPMAPSSLIAFKSDFSACLGSTICDYVKREGFSTIILSGLFEGDIKRFSDCCITVTGCDFRQEGYDVVIAAEATERGIPGAIDVDRELLHSPLDERRHFHAQWDVAVDPIADLTAKFRRPSRVPYRQRTTELIL